VTTPLQINRYDRLARRLMNLVGEGAIVTGVLEDVFPVIDVENLATDGWAVAGWRPAWGGANIAGAAGERAHVQIHNPVGSGVIAVVESVMLSSPTNTSLDFNIHDAVLTTLFVSGRWRDRRFPTLNFPVVQVRGQSIVGTPIVAAMRLRLQSNTTMIWDPPQGDLVLVEGTGVAFAHATLTGELSGVFFWRERPAEPAELNI